MERRHFLKLAFGFAAGGMALAATAQAAPLMPQPLSPGGPIPANPDAHPAVTSGDEVDRLKLGMAMPPPAGCRRAPSVGGCAAWNLQQRYWFCSW